MPSRILAIDIGTSSTKGLLVDAAGEVKGFHQIGYELQAPRPGHAEQDPVEILAAVRGVIDALAPRGVDLVFGSAMHSVIGLDATGAPRTPVITWADQRSAAVAAELRRGDLAAGLHARTGTPLHAMSPLCKIRHMRQSDAARFAEIARFVSIKEFVIEAMTGVQCVDHSVASATGLFDVQHLAWDDEALELAGIDAGRLSALVLTTHVIEDVANARNIVVGATDGVLANLGVAEEGEEKRGAAQICITLGTSGAARVMVDQPRTDARGRLFCYVLDERSWVIGGAINNGGLVLRWLRDTIALTGATDDEVVRAAESVPPGADGLMFVPALTGERYPTYSDATGASLSRLTLGHGRDHILRAGLEGMMSAFAPLVAELSRGMNDAQGPIRIGGGVFEWAFCRQLLADVLGRTVTMPESKESSALGGARLGFAALGIEHGWNTDMKYTHEPDARNHGIYSELVARRQRHLEESPA